MLNRTVGQRSRTLVMTSPSARACGAHISPMQEGNSGSGSLRSASNRPSPLSFMRNWSICSFSPPPEPILRMSSPMKLNRVCLTQMSALPCTTTRSPCLNEAAFEANARQPDTDMAMSSTSSRTVRYAEPARRVLISVICPAIHAAGQRSTAVWNFWLSTLTGQGLSAVVSAARRGSWSKGLGMRSPPPSDGRCIAIARSCS